jgi:hypothetical protein
MLFEVRETLIQVQGTTEQVIELLRALDFTYGADFHIFVYMIFSNVRSRSVNSRTPLSLKK